MTLKRCPFCGGKAGEIWPTTGDNWFAIGCLVCGAQTQTGTNPALIEHLWNRRAAGWISVEDALPECGKGVLVKTTEGIDLACRWDVFVEPYLRRWRYEWEWCAKLRSADGGHGGYCFISDITHWMPLPEPPEQEPEPEQEPKPPYRVRIYGSSAVYCPGPNCEYLLRCVRDDDDEFLTCDNPHCKMHGKKFEMLKFDLVERA